MNFFKDSTTKDLQEILTGVAAHGTRQLVQIVWAVITLTAWFSLMACFWLHMFATDVKVVGPTIFFAVVFISCVIIIQGGPR